MFGPFSNVPSSRDIDNIMLDHMAAKAEREAANHEPPGAYTIGLDLGKQRDPSALSVVERKGKAPAYQHLVRHLHRWPLGTSYPDIVADLAALVGKMPREHGAPQLATDVTGVGMGVFDFIKQAKLPVRHTPILIVSGRAVTQDERGVWHVPKIELVSTMAAVLGAQRLAVANLPLAPVLKRELGTFTVKVTAAGNETYEAWREKDHDDIVLSVAMAVWTGERQRRTPVIIF